MIPIFVVLWQQEGEVREVVGGGLIVIHGDATTTWHAKVRHGLDFRHRAGARLGPKRVQQFASCLHLQDVDSRRLIGKFVFGIFAKTGIVQ